MFPIRALARLERRPAAVDRTRKHRARERVVRATAARALALSFVECSARRAWRAGEERRRGRVLGARAGAGAGAGARGGREGLERERDGRVGRVRVVERDARVAELFAERVRLVRVSAADVEEHARAKYAVQHALRSVTMSAGSTAVSEESGIHNQEVMQLRLSKVGSLL